MDSRDAGVTNISFVSEPEAAALATLHDMGDRHDVAAGDAFVVVDCGGGTVDIISYEVISSQPITVRECVKGQGALCGSVFVDDAFASLLEDKIRQKDYGKISQATQRRIMTDEWEHGIKRQFTNAVSSRSWSITLPFECLSRKSRGSLRELPTLNFTSDDIRGAFNTVLGQIKTLIYDQISAVKNKKFGQNPKYIILVGGFGRCKYLYESFKAEFDIDLLQSRGSRPWVAICRGAVIHDITQQSICPSIGIQVTSRVSRASYGISSSMPWEEGRYLPSDKYYCPREMRWFADNQMEWFLLEGQDVSSKAPVRRQFYRYLKEPPSSISDTVMMSFASPPPTRMDSMVHVLCEVKWDPDIAFAKIPIWKNPYGEVFYKLEHHCDMTFSGGSVDFAIYHEGKCVGSKNLTISFKDRYTEAKRV